MASLRRVFSCLAALLCAGAFPFEARAANGPGLGNLTYAPGELFTSLASVMSPFGQGNVAMVNGYLMVIYSTDAGGTAFDGGIDFWSVENPRVPYLHVRYDNANTHGLREPHGFGFSNSYPGDYMVAQAHEGIQFWNVTDPDAISMIHYMDVPGINPSDYTGAWWVFWQAPYVYIAAVDQGLYVVDATNPASPVLVRQVLPSAIGGINPGQVFAIGNLMLVARNKDDGFATLDISDPTNPTLIAVLPDDGTAGYSHILAGAGKILTSGGEGDGSTMVVHDVSGDGTQISYVGEGTTLGNGFGGYGAYQDGYFHSGFSNLYAKYRVSDFERVGFLQPGGFGNADFDFAVPLGNVIFLGNDHGTGSPVVVHQIEPDSAGPDVHWVNPPHAATGMALTTRVGLSMSDMVDIESVNAGTFAVRPVGGSPLPGKYSYQMGLVNFSPDQPLQPNTVYEVVVNGIEDWVGNAGGSFTSHFGTGNFTAPTCTLGVLAPALVGATANLDVATVNGTQPLTYSWSFGDGSPPTPPVGTSATSHAWQAAGRYPVLLTVENPFGSSSCSAVQIAHSAPTPLPPAASSPIVHAGGRVFTVNPDSNTVTALSTTSLAVLWEAAVGADPRTLAVAPNGDVWVVNHDDATISVLDPNDGGLLDTIQLARGSQPYGIAFAPNGAAAYVTLTATGRVLKLTPGGAIVGNAPVGPFPRAIAVSADSNRLLVTRFVSRAIDPEDTESLPYGEVYELSASTLAPVRTFEVEYDPGPDTEAGGRGVPNYLSSIRISPDGTHALVPSKKDNVTRGLFVGDQPLTFESRTRTIVSELDLLANEENESGRVDFNNRDMAQAVAYSPLGDIYFVALQGSNLVEVRAAGSGGFLGAMTPQSAPQGLTVDAATGRLFVQNFMSRSVSAFDVSGLLDATENAATLLAHVPTVDQELLPAQVLLGKRIFYNASDPRMSLDGYISCASCHTDGGSDGQVWDFTQVGEGLRNTIELQGRGGTAQGDVHWTANFDEIQDFENDIRLGFSGMGFLTNPQFAATEDPLGAPKAGLSADLDALAAYVASLDAFPVSPYRNSNGTLTDDARAGMVLFLREQCTTCHSGSAFSDGQRHDVGTIQPSSGLGLGFSLVGVGFDTPTLKGVWTKPPYLHNGQAATLDDVFVESGHGSVGHLSPLERGKLIAYIQQLEDADLPPAAILRLSGSAQGGQVSVVILGVETLVSTSAGQTPADVAAALAAAIEANPLLDGVSATAVEGSVVTTEALGGVAVTDPGLGAQEGFGSLVPALEPAVVLALALLLAGAVPILLAARRRAA
jgi:mono/diheme cytochrome c family protein/PKD repeat protein